MPIVARSRCSCLRSTLRFAAPLTLGALIACGSDDARDASAGAGAEAASGPSGAAGPGGPGGPGSGGAGATGGNGGGGEGSGAGGAAGWWSPTADAPIAWHWQLSSDFDASDIALLPEKKVFDLDGELTSAETVAALHALGPDVKVICYFDAGVYEDYRSDAQAFVDAGLADGPPDIGWEGSYWIDIRKLDALMPLLERRMKEWCRDKGFDAIEPDETEVWANWNEQLPDDPITLEENNAFHQAIAAMAHGLGLSVGLKGNNTEAEILEPLYDWALTEQCWEYEECTFFRDSFVAAGKAVFAVEYDADPDCALSNEYRINASKRDLDLVGPGDGGYLYEPCVPDGAAAWP